MDAYRKMGIYDKSTIVILSDHGINITKPGVDLKGVPQEAFPFLMIKTAGDSGAYAESRLPTSHSGVADIVRALVRHPVDRRETERLLFRERRMCRNVDNGKIHDWYISADGDVRHEVRPDEEPELASIRALEAGKKYDLKIGEGEANYPDFVLGSGRRNGVWGATLFPAEDGRIMKMKIRLPKARVSFDVTVTGIYFDADQGFSVEASAGVGKSDTVAVIDRTVFPLRFVACSEKDDGVVELDFSVHAAVPRGALELRFLELKEH